LLSWDICVVFHIWRSSRKHVRNIGYASANKTRPNAGDTRSASESLETIQRRVARWITRKFGHTTSVSALLNNFHLEPRVDHRRISRLTFLYKVRHERGTAKNLQSLFCQFLEPVCLQVSDPGALVTPPHAHDVQRHWLQYYIYIKRSFILSKCSQRLLSFLL